MNLVVQEDSSATSYVVRKSLRPKELAGTLLGFIHSPEILPLLVGLLTALILADINLFRPLSPLPPLLALAWTIWEIRGNVIGFGLYDGRLLVGGLRARINQNRAKLTILGVYVEPSYRCASGATMLVGAALEKAQNTLAFDGLVIAYAPTHPASKRLVKNYLGHKRLRIGSRDFERAQQLLMTSNRPLSHLVGLRTGAQEPGPGAAQPCIIKR